MRYGQIALLLWVVSSTVHPAFTHQNSVSVANRERLLFYEDFSKDMGNWWVEGRGRVWIQDDRLYVNATGSKKLNENVSTVWCRFQFPNDIHIEFDAHVISSPTNVNNINLFFSYSDPDGVPLFESRHQRKTGAYSLYHRLNGYIITYLNDSKHNRGIFPENSGPARFRFRRCPGFHLIQERYDYHCRQGTTYHVEMTKKGNRLTYSVDGVVYLDADDDDPLSGGMLGLRTFSTFLWWDNVRIYTAE